MLHVSITLHLVSNIIITAIYKKGILEIQKYARLSAIIIPINKILTVSYIIECSIEEIKLGTRATGYFIWTLTADLHKMLTGLLCTPQGRFYYIHTDNRALSCTYQYIILLHLNITITETQIIDTILYLIHIIKQITIQTGHIASLQHNRIAYNIFSCRHLRSFIRSSAGAQQRLTL